MNAIGKIVKQDLHEITQKQTNPEGFSLIEATIALTTLGICLAYAMPLFLYSKMNNVKSEIRTGALMASQQIFDDIRGLPFQNIPKTATDPNGPGGSRSTVINPNGTIAAGTTSETIPKNRYTIMGRDYTARVFYCETVLGTPTECNDNYKKFRVEIKDKNNRVVYDMEAGFTNFQ
jgi:type II secretory pathway pseudopilin PulG